MWQQYPGSNTAPSTHLFNTAINAAINTVIKKQDEWQNISNHVLKKNQ